MDLSEYQRRANQTDQRPVREDEDDMALVFPLMGMASEVGSLVTQYKKHVRDGDAHPLFSERVKEELGDVLWYVANLAGKLDLDLNSVAELNLKRTAERWPAEGETTPSKLLDDDNLPSEQLPRQVAVVFEEVDVDGRMKLCMTVNGERLGNPLVDMNYDADGYRFHDAFHLAYAATLGWSPLTRALFGVKRDSSPDVREVEDGARAVFIEEGLAAFVFSYAREHNFFEGVNHIDAEVLRSVAGIVSHLEVRTRTINDWQKAILRSYDIWRALRGHNGGIVTLDLRTRTIDFAPPASGSMQR